jgi:hypothetical protein
MAACFLWHKAKKKNQNGRLNKISFSSNANPQYFFMKFLWFGPSVGKIDWCEWHWCCSFYMVMRLSDISSKTGKKCGFWLFLRLCRTDHISWATPMPFASINSTNPRTNLYKFHIKIVRIGGAGKLCFFETAFLNFLSQPFWFFFYAPSQWKKKPVYMRYHFFLHYGWFFQNLGKEAVRTFMHTTVLAESDVKVNN